MSSCPAAITTRLGLIPQGMFRLSKSTSWPSSIQESKILWYRGVLHRLLTALLVFHKKMHLNCFSICDPMRQILLLPVWLANACVITLYPADLFWQVLLIKSTCIQLNVWPFVWRMLTDWSFISDITYLKTILPPTVEEEFYTFLKEIDSSKVILSSILEGSIVFPKVPMIRLEGPLPGILKLIVPFCNASLLSVKLIIN